MPSVDTRTALAMSEVAKLELSFDDLMARLLDLTEKKSQHTEADLKIKGCMSGLYSVFVDTLSYVNEMEQTITEKGNALTVAMADLAEYRATEAASENKLAAQVEKLEAFTDDTSNPVLLEHLAAIRTQLSDNASWQKRLRRYTDNISELQDEVVELQHAESELEYNNNALKSELCGRIQQVQLISKGMATGDSAVYSRILSEMEQNSMKAYARHARQVSPTGRASIVPVRARSTSGATSPNTARFVKRTVRSVTIPRGPKGCGVTIMGGDGTSTSATVHRITSGGPAEETGEVFVDDLILSINGKPLSGFTTHADIVSEIGSGPEVTFELHSMVSDAEMQTRKSRPTSLRFNPNGENELELGDTVVVTGYEGTGTVRFVGLHHKPERGVRVFVELQLPVGKNDGVIDGVRYANVKPKHGVFVHPNKVKLVSATTVATPIEATLSAPFGITISGAPGFGTFVTEVLPGGAAAQVGTIVSGMKIVEVAGVDSTTLKYEKVVDLLRSADGPMKLKFLLDRPGYTNLVKATLASVKGAGAPTVAAESSATAAAPVSAVKQKVDTPLAPGTAATPAVVDSELSGATADASVEKPATDAAALAAPSALPTAVDGEPDPSGSTSKPSTTTPTPAAADSTQAPSGVAAPTAESAPIPATRDSGPAVDESTGPTHDQAPNWPAKSGGNDAATSAYMPAAPVQNDQRTGPVTDRSIRGAPELAAVDLPQTQEVRASNFNLYSTA